MKRFVFVCVIMIVLGLCCQSCQRMSHNFTTIAAGKVARLGIADYGLLYVNGLVVMEAVRENTETVVETNDGDGFNNPNSIVKGIRSIQFRTGPQVTGYLKDLAKKDPKAAEKYVNIMGELNKAQWQAHEQKPIDVDLPKGETVQSAAEKAKAIIEPFTCNGNCDLQDLWKNNSIAYQTSVANKLLTYTDETSGWEGEFLTFKHSLETFITRLAKLTTRGRTVTQMRVKYAKIKDNKLVDLKFIMIEPDGRQFDTNCPECVLEDE